MSWIQDSASPTLKKREDEFSFQYASAASSRFWLRIPKHAPAYRLTISDLQFSDDEVGLIAQSLRSAEQEHGIQLEDATVWIADILPGSRQHPDHDELVQRFDRLAAALQAAARILGLPARDFRMESDGAGLFSLSFRTGRRG